MFRVYDFVSRNSLFIGDSVLEILAFLNECENIPFNDCIIQYYESITKEWYSFSENTKKSILR